MDLCRVLCVAAHGMWRFVERRQGFVQGLAAVLSHYPSACASPSRLLMHALLMAVGLPAEPGRWIAGVQTWRARPELHVQTRVCSGCEVARYCGPKCQRAAWKGHRGACRALQASRRGEPAC